MLKLWSPQFKSAFLLLQGLFYLMVLNRIVSIVSQNCLLLWKASRLKIKIIFNRLFWLTFTPFGGFFLSIALSSHLRKVYSALLITVLNHVCHPCAFFFKYLILHHKKRESKDPYLNWGVHLSYSGA